MTWNEIFILFVMVMVLFAIDILVAKWNLKAGRIVAVLTFLVLFPLGLVAGVAALICMNNKGKQRKFSITALFKNDLFHAFLFGIAMLFVIDMILLKLFPDATFPVLFLSFGFSPVFFFLVAKVLDYLKEKARKPKTIDLPTTSKKDNQKQKNNTATNRPSIPSGYATPQHDPYFVSDDHFRYDPDYQDYLQGNIRPSRYQIEHKVADNGQEYTTLKSEKTELAAFYREQNEKAAEKAEETKKIRNKNTSKKKLKNIEKDRKNKQKNTTLATTSKKDNQKQKNNTATNRPAISSEYSPSEPVINSVSDYLYHYDPDYQDYLQGNIRPQRYRNIHLIPDIRPKYTDQTAKIVFSPETTEIKEREFENREDIVSVVIPESVIKIGEYAFCVCENLKSVVISEGVKEIGSEAFRYCKNLESVIIPDSVTKIGAGAFRGCESLVNVNIPKSVDKIADSLFRGCEKLSSSVIHNRITDIGQNAFVGCVNLSSIVIPDSVKTIGKAAFCQCAKLVSVEIPENIKEIEEVVFSDCENLTEVTVKSAGVTRIGNRAFRGCHNLSSVKLHEGVISIGVSAFGECTNLSSVTIPDSVVWLGGYAFEHCVNLTHVTLPKNLNSMGDYVFFGCKNLNAIDIPENIIPDLCSNGSLSGCLALKSFKIPYGVTEIAYNMFSNCENLNTVEIPNTVERIGNHAFSGCKNLEYVNLPNSVKTIGEDAFIGCDKISDDIKGMALSKIPRIVPVATSYNTPYDDPQCDDNYNPDKYNYELRVAGNGQEYYARIN